MRIPGVVIFVAFVISHVFADDSAYVNDVDYDNGAYGWYPTQRYKTVDFVSPRINILQSSPECSNGIYTMFTPRGTFPSASAMILDSEGHLVWTISGYGEIYNLMVQEYLGEKYLTFWAGNDAVGGHGAGYYYMVCELGNKKAFLTIQFDSSYKEVFKISAAGGLSGDLHEFVVTENGTALITVYEIVSTDLSELGKSSIGYIWDCLVQEIKIATGELKFQWRASDHYKVSDTFRPIDDDGGDGRSFDFFHINSIDKDPQGNYLISSRNMHTITYISGATGETIWILGGRGNMFEDLSGGGATNFAYQHDARWSDDYTTITIFDNGRDDDRAERSYTRGLRIKLDQQKMMAELIAEYINPNNIFSVSQGSFQTLENGNSFMGYGNSPAMTEYSYNGTALCDMHFGPQNRFGAGDAMSYRSYKYEWHGWPNTHPDTKILRNDQDDWTFYVSWNGATEVVHWILQGAADSEADDEEWEDLEGMDKVGFETGFEIETSYPGYLRVIGLDNKGEVLGYSSPLDVRFEKVRQVVISL